MREECGGDDADAITPPVCLVAGGDHDSIEEVRPNPVGEPPEMTHVGVRDRVRQLDFER